MNETTRFKFQRQITLGKSAPSSLLLGKQPLSHGDGQRLPAGCWWRLQASVLRPAAVGRWQRLAKSPQSVN